MFRVERCGILLDTTHATMADRNQLASVPDDLRNCAELQARLL
jgi:hypothetical protein